MKVYPDGSQEITVSSHRLFRERGWEPAGKKKPRASSGEVPKDESVKRSIRRARSRLRDYARSNRFSYFVTLTLDTSKVTDRYDIWATVKNMTAWLDNRCRRDGLQYILVPERHKDGAIHFHGFVNDALEVVDSGTLTHGGKPRRPRSKQQRESMLREGWRVVYNLPAWPFGFSTALDLYGEYEAAVAYCCKYIGKQMGEELPEKIGGRWYYSGGHLRLPEIAALDLDFDRLLQEQPENAWSMSGGYPDMLRFFVKEGWNFDDEYRTDTDSLERDNAPGTAGLFRDTVEGLPEEWRE